ncbi:MAG: DUF4252 domain-containing protein [Bacteroidales bacterium]|nr:DUF4252 domain-containing protein [Bacteroidales bacterium]
MQKRIVILVVLLIGSLAYARADKQVDPVDRYMWKSSRAKDCHLIYVPGIVKWFFVNKVEDKTIKKLIIGCKGIKIMSFESKKYQAVDLNEQADLILKKMSKANYYPLLEVMSEGEKVMICVKKHKRRKNELKGLAILAYEEDELVLVKIKGKFNLEDLNVSELISGFPKSVEGL